MRGHTSGCVSFMTSRTRTHSDQRVHLRRSIARFAVAFDLRRARAPQYRGRMKLLASTIVVGLGLAISQQAYAAPPINVTLGSGAVADFESTSADGCTHTTGQVVVLKATPGAELANGLYVTGMQEDLCNGTFGSGFAGYAPGGYVVPLITAGFTGTVVVDSYSGGPPVTLELDLRWFGTGAITRTGGVFDDGSAIQINWSRSRAARTAGQFLLDGEPAVATAASLVFQAQGTITH